MEMRHWLVENLWVGEIVLLALSLFLVHVILKKFLARSKHVDFATTLPFRILLWILFFTFSADLVVQKFSLGVFEFISSLRNIGIIFCVAWFLIRWRKVFHRAMVGRTKKPALDATSLEILGKLFTIIVGFVSLLIILQILGLDIVPLVTFGGIGAAALGIASKDVVSNFFGALMLYGTRPFSPGDLIELPEKRILGSVESIGWYHTAVRDLHKKPIYIPNSTFPLHALINWSRMTHRRIDETLAIRSQDAEKALSVIEAIRSLLEQHIAIDHHQPIYVFFQSYRESSLELAIQAYTLSTRYEEFMEVKQKVLLEIKQIIDQAGAEIAPPVMVIKQ